MKPTKRPKGRPKGSPKDLASRRADAARLLSQGRSLSEVADKFNVSVSSARRWKEALTQGGIEALEAVNLPGPRPGLSASQKADLAEVFMRGAAASGYEKKNEKKNRWFAKDIVDVIERLYGITYHEKYIWRLLRKVGISQADLRSRGFRVAQ